ncbi:unnamed protein product, partial [Pylaiella littoralis]
MAENKNDGGYFQPGDGSRDGVDGAGTSGSALRSTSMSALCRGDQGGGNPQEGGARNSTSFGGRAQGNRWTSQEQGKGQGRGSVYASSNGGRGRRGGGRGEGHTNGRGYGGRHTHGVHQQNRNELDRRGNGRGGRGRGHTNG